MGVVAVCTLIVSAILTAIYLFGVAGPMYFRPVNRELEGLTSEKHDPSWMMKLPLTVLCIAMVVLGVYSQPLVTFLRGIAAGTIF